MTFVGAALRRPAPVAAVLIGGVVLLLWRRRRSG